jgi:hypothetical protein
MYKFNENLIEKLHKGQVLIDTNQDILFVRLLLKYINPLDYEDIKMTSTFKRCFVEVDRNGYWKLTDLKKSRLLPIEDFIDIEVGSIWVDDGVTIQITEIENGIYKYDYTKNNFILKGTASKKGILKNYTPK